MTDSVIAWVQKFNNLSPTAICVDLIHRHLRTSGNLKFSLTLQLVILLQRNKNIFISWFKHYSSCRDHSDNFGNWYSCTQLLQHWKVKTKEKQSELSQNKQTFWTCSTYMCYSAVNMLILHKINKFIK
jgi:hypothetical protein